MSEERVVLPVILLSPSTVTALNSGMLTQIYTRAGEWEPLKVTWIH